MGDIEDGPSDMNSQSSMSNASSFCYGFTSWYRVPSSNPKSISGNSFNSSECLYSGL